MKKFREKNRHSQCKCIQYLINDMQISLYAYARYFSNESWNTAEQHIIMSWNGNIFGSTGEGNLPVTDGFPYQRSVMRSFNNASMNKLLTKKWSCLSWCVKNGIRWELSPDSWPFVRKNCPCCAANRPIIQTSCYVSLKLLEAIDWQVEFNAVSLLRHHLNRQGVSPCLGIQWYWTLDSWTHSKQRLDLDKKGNAARLRFIHTDVMILKRYGSM